MRAALLLIVFVGCSTDTFTGPDGSTGGDAGVGDADTNCMSNFCATQKATTCNDFDSLAKNWSVDPTNDSSITVGTTTSNVTSCPNALQVVMPTQNASVTEPHGYVIATNLGTPGDVTVVMDALLPNIPDNDAGIFDGFVFFALRGTVDGTWSVRLERSGDRSWFLRVHQGAGEQHTGVTNILTGAWNHMTLNVHYKDDTTGSASLTYQTQGAGQMTASIPSVQTLPSTGASQSTTFAIGAGALSAVSQQYTFLYDSITIQAN